MIVANVLEHLERYAPLALAQAWDNSGLLIGDSKRQVGKVLITLDVTANALSYAIDHGFDLILSHHPLIFQPLSSITDPTILRLIEAKISLISMHTNFDAAVGGVNYALADTLALEVQGSLGDPEAGDIGLICSSASPKSLYELAKDIKARLQITEIKLWTAGLKLDTTVNRIAICGGAGSSALAKASLQADLLITGDVSYHSFLDSKIPIIDAGHFATEYPALKVLQQSLKSIGIESEILDRRLHEWTQNLKHI